MVRNSLRTRSRGARARAAGSRRKRYVTPPRVGVAGGARAAAAGDAHPAFLSAGTFGCTYFPGFNCRGDALPRETRVLTKLARRSEPAGVESREERVSRLVRALPHFDQFFAPVLRTCEASRRVLEAPDEGGDCEVLAKHPDEQYEVHTMRYVGKRNLEQLVDAIARRGAARALPAAAARAEYWRKAMVSFYDWAIRLDMAMQLLRRASVVHYDLKANNVMMSEFGEPNLPVIIDFGLSLPMRDVYAAFQREGVAGLKDYFYNDSANYPAWCLETVLLSALVAAGADDAAPWDFARDVEPRMEAYFANDFLAGRLGDPERARALGARYRAAYAEAARRRKMRTARAWATWLLGSWRTWDLVALAMVLWETVDLWRRAAPALPGADLLVSLLVESWAFSPHAERRAVKTIVPALREMQRQLL